MNFSEKYCFVNTVIVVEKSPAAVIEFNRKINRCYEIKKVKTRRNKNV